MPKRQERLNDNDKAVLVEMSDDRIKWIAPMAADTNLSQSEVRRSYRKLRRMGLAHYGTSWNEDDYRVGGSGYSLTDAGVSERDRLRKETK